VALLKQFKTDFGDIRITRCKSDGTTAYYQNGCFHSQANRRGTSICAYVHVLHELIRQSHARDVLIVGCAGGTLATMLRRLHARVTVVDINPMSFVIARRFFHLPETVRCVRQDGIAHIRSTRKRYDAVVIDVFGSDNTVPKNFRSSSFFESVQDVLAPSGIMLMNVIARDDEDFRADQIALNAQKAGFAVELFDWPGETDRNVLLSAGNLGRAQIPSGHEPGWIRKDLEGIVRRRPYPRPRAHPAAKSA
jgi:spermidine synthase